MSTRRDISDKLIHFTKGENEEAFQHLRNIVEERHIIGTSEKIKGGYKCVCFSEAPLTSLEDGFVNPDAYSRYSPFGIILEKRWLYEQGGRPVIYQTNEEFNILPPELQWRHVRYEPNKEPPVDFTWEREWRIQCDFLQIDPAYAGIVVTNESWAQRIIDEHEAEQDFMVLQYSEILDELIAEQYREAFPWRIFKLV